MEVNFIVTILFWLISIGCGSYALFTDAWQNDKGFLKSWPPRRRMFFFRGVGFFLFFLGVWMLMRTFV